MKTKLTGLLRRSRREQEGGIFAEYIAVIVIIAAVIAAIWALNIDEKVSDCGGDAVDSLFTDDADVSVDC